MLYQGGFMDNIVVNQVYLQSTTIKEIKQQFKYQTIPSIQLCSFFQQKIYEQIKEEIKQLNYAEKKQPIHYSYQQAEVSKSLNTLFNNKNILKLISTIVNKKVTIISIKALKLTWKSYTLLHDKLKEKPGIDIILEITNNWPRNSGGKIIYTDTNKNTYIVQPSENTLTIIDSRKNIQRYIEYCNHYSKNKYRYVILMQAD